jgi:twitching motility two-component system response regulator PilH
METLQRILLVDDDPLIERAYSSLLEQAGFQVETVSTAADAISKVKENPPDAVLLDLFLPKVNGVEVLKFIRSQRVTRDLPVVVFSTSATSRYVDAAWREGATQFMAKDQFKPSQIVEELGKLVKQAKDKPKELDLSGLDLAEGSERQKAFGCIPALKTGLRDQWVVVANAEDGRRITALSELSKTVQALLDQAEVIGAGMILQLLQPFESLLKELQQTPRSIGLSTLRTSVQAVDLAVILCDYAVELSKEPLVPGLLLLASSRVSSSDLAIALKRTNLTIVGGKDVPFCLELSEQNRFNLIFWDPDMPGPSASDILGRLRGQHTNKSAHIVFFAKADNFENQAREAVGGGFDIIGKPILAYELAVKAVTYIVRDRLNSLTVDA